MPLKELHKSNIVFDLVLRHAIKQHLRYFKKGKKEISDFDVKSIEAVLLNICEMQYLRFAIINFRQKQFHADEDNVILTATSSFLLAARIFEYFLLGLQKSVPNFL